MRGGAGRRGVGGDVAPESPENRGSGEQRCGCFQTLEGPPGSPRSAEKDSCAPGPLGTEEPQGLQVGSRDMR